MPPKAIPLQMIEKHHQRLETESKSLNEAINLAINTIKEEFNKKRNDLKDKLNRFKNEEQDLTNNFRQIDTQLQQEIARFEVAIEGVSVGQTEFQQVEAQDFHRRSQVMVQIFSDTHREIESTIRDYKEKTRRVEQVANKTVSPKPTYDGQQIRTFIEQRKNVTNDLLQKLTDIHRDFDKLTKNLTELESKELKELNDTEKKCSDEEDKERKKEAENFKKQSVAMFDKK